MLDAKRRFAATLDMLFGKGISSSLPLDRLEFVYSKRTGKVKHVMLDGKMLCTLRKDGGIALTVELARLMLNNNGMFMEHCIIVSNDIVKHVAKGRSVFCKHVKHAGRCIQVGGEVAILDEDKNVVAVGKAALPASIIKDMRYGVAVKVRDGIE